MKIELFRREQWLCAHIEGEKCAWNVRPVWASPLSRPNRYLALLDSKDKEFALIVNPQEELDADSWSIAQEEMKRRDLTARVARIESVREDGGAAYFVVETDRGRREFVANNLSTNALFYGESRLMLLDVDGNRFDFPDLEALDERSRALLDGIL
ncbi:hypothetical protein IAD21_03280 [Abditibacteriota bacterium]|nr:hypothetical protein IAD21_03280 [Abditibacteriota bacterium]